VRLFASRIADAILEGQQIATEGGVAPQAEDGEVAVDEATPGTAATATTPSTATETAEEPGQAAAPVENKEPSVAAEPSTAPEPVDADSAAKQSAESVVAAS
jgi:hypothetical protein